MFIENLSCLRLQRRLWSCPTLCPGNIQMARSAQLLPFAPSCLIRLANRVARGNQAAAMLNQRRMARGKTSVACPTAAEPSGESLNLLQ
jgi:hypothetical protein